MPNYRELTHSIEAIANAGQVRHHRQRSVSIPAKEPQRLGAAARRKEERPRNALDRQINLSIHAGYTSRHKLPKYYYQLAL